jgi:hypothetical protein
MRKSYSLPARKLVKYRVIASVVALVEAVEWGISRTEEEPSVANNEQTTRIWIPLPIIHMTLPHLLKDCDKCPSNYNVSIAAFP